jgi:hypothetical protein
MNDKKNKKWPHSQCQVGSGGCCGEEEGRKERGREREKLNFINCDMAFNN